MGSVALRDEGWQLPKLAPSVVARGLLLPRLRELLEAAGWFPVIVAVLVAWWSTKYAVAPLWLLAVVVGSWQTHVRVTGRQPSRGWLTARRALCLTLIAALSVPMLVVLDRPRIGSAVALVLLELLLRQPSGAAVTPPWWSHARLAGALVKAGVLPADGWVTYIGKPKHDEHGGTTVVVELHPETVSWRQMRAKHEVIAAALGKAPKRLELTNDPDWPANHVRVWVGEGSREVRRLALTGRQDWSEPVPFGDDARGRTTSFLTRGRHSVFVGQTGSGKTAAARLVVAHALLDPDCQVLIIDGKDVSSDWRPAAPLCAEYVGGSGAASVRRVAELLQALEDERERRADAGSDVPDLVLVIDEYYKIRRAAERIDKALLTRIDGLLGELAATARSARIHIVMCVQRGTVEFLPGDLQANLSQRLVGQVTDKAEARYVLDLAPPVLPAQAGEFLVSEDGREPVLVTVPFLDDAGWRQVCKVAADVRDLRARHTAAVSLVKRSPAPAPAPTCTPLAEAVLELLEAAGGPLTATELHELLPEHVRPATPLALGKLLADEPGLTRKYRGKLAAWAPSAAPAADPRQALTTTYGTGPVDLRPGVQRRSGERVEALEGAAPAAPTVLP